MKQYEEIYKNSLLFELQKKWNINVGVKFTKNTISFSFYDRLRIYTTSHFGITGIIKKELDLLASTILSLINNIEKVIDDLETSHPSYISRNSHRELKIGSMELTFCFEILEYKKNELKAVMSIKEENNISYANEIRLFTNYQFFLEGLEETIFEFICTNAARNIFVEKAKGSLHWYSDEEGLLLATSSTTTNIKCEKKGSDSVHLKAISRNISIVDTEDTLENVLKTFEKAITIQAKKERLSNLFSR